MLGVTRVVGEHECGVLFRLGRVLDPPRGPGRVWRIPGIHRLVVVDLRPMTLELPREEVTTWDGLPLEVSARLHARVVAPTDAVMRVVSYTDATVLIARAALHATFKEYRLDEARRERARIETTLQQEIDAATTAWGVTVPAVEIEVGAAAT